MTSSAGHASQNHSPNMDLSDFKHHLYAQLKAAGVMSSLKIQLRSQVLSKLQKRECLLHHTPDSESALWLSVLNSLVQQHLASSNYHYTLSVFQPEAGLSGQHSFGHKDIMQIMQIEPSTPLFKAIAEGGPLAVADGQTSPAGSFLMGLLQAVAAVLGAKAVSEVAVQTAQYDGSPLSLALQQLESSYLKQTKEERERPYKNMEQRLTAYRQECEARLQHELQLQVGQVREVEVRAARLEGIAEAKQVVEHERSQLQQQHQDKLLQLQSQEQQMTERLKVQQQEQEASWQQQKQLLQSQEEDLASWKADADRQLSLQQERLEMRQQRLSSREQQLTRQDAEAACQVAEAQAAAAAAYSRARQDLHQDYKSQREALATERQGIDADRGRMQHLEAEVARLQSSCRKLQAAEASWAEAEARAAAHAGAEQALRYQLTHLQNAVKGTGTLGQSGEEEGRIQAVYPGQGRPLGAMQTMALQMRKLQKKQKGTARELQAAAAREAFWKDTAQATEQALDEAMDRREEAVQQVEEARLALRAAQRNNAELQTRLQQAAMQSRPGRSHSRPATAGRLGAAPIDRAYASATASPNSKLGDLGSHQNDRERQDLSLVKSQLATQRQARAQQLRQLLQASADTSVSGTTALSASVASSLSGYSTDQEGGSPLAGLSPMPFVSPAHLSGPHMQARLHTSSSAAPAPDLPRGTHSYSPAPGFSPAPGATSVLLQPGHLHPHAGSMHSSMLDRASHGSHAVHAQHSHPMPGYPSADNTHQAESHASQHAPSLDYLHSFNVAPASHLNVSAAPFVPDAALSALPQGKQDNESQHAPQQKPSAHAAMQEQSKSVTPIAFPSPAVLTSSLQHQLLPRQLADSGQINSGQTDLGQISSVPTNSAPSKPEPLPQAMSSFNNSGSKPQLTAPATLPWLSSSALRAVKPSALAGSGSHHSEHATGSLSSQLHSSLQPSAADAGASGNGVGQPAQPGSAGLTLQHVATADSLSSRAAPVGVQLQDADLPAQCGTSAASTVRSQAQQASGSGYLNMFVTSSSNSTAVQPRSLAQAVSLTMYPLGMTHEEEAESPLGGRPVQSETALLKGRNTALSEPQDLHAAHLMHVLEAHTTQLRLAESSSDTQPSAEPLGTDRSQLTPHNDALHAATDMPHELSTSGTEAPGSVSEEAASDGDMGTHHLPHAAQPILFPVMPVQAAATETSPTVQPALDSSLQLDISRPIEEAAASDPLRAPDQAQPAPNAAFNSVSNVSVPGQAQQQSSFGMKFPVSAQSQPGPAASGLPEVSASGPVQEQAASAFSMPTGSLNPAQDSPSQASTASESEDEGFPRVDYSDVYKISQAFVSQHDDKEDLPDAELASLGSISVAETDLEAADFEVASEGSVF